MRVIKKFESFGYNSGYDVKKYSVKESVSISKYFGITYDRRAISLRTGSSIK
jgi:hypothetical protein